METPAILDASHDPERRSWVSTAEDPLTDFPIQNLPFGRFRRQGEQESWRIGVAIGDQILDLARTRAAGGWTVAIDDWLAPLAAGDLNRFMSAGPAARQGIRQAMATALDARTPRTDLVEALVPQSQAEFSLPCQIGDYTDFYTGIHHATAVGRLFRPDQPLLPNYKWVPIGYHGRTSSIVVSGHPIRRPHGQSRSANAEHPAFGPSSRLDFALELGFVVGTGNALGNPVRMADAESHLFGVCLLNDWSARDIQPWEYQPLGPFLAKNFATSLSPWVVTLEALAPFRVPLLRPEGDPQPLPYLDSAANRAQGGLDIVLEAWLSTVALRDAGQSPVRLSASRAAEAAYWTPAQLLTHHTSGGCNLQPGDLLGSGTLSGSAPEAAGSLLELTQAGREALTLPNGEQRTFLADGDILILRGHCSHPGWRRIGFGECAGMILPALPFAD